MSEKCEAFDAKLLARIAESNATFAQLQVFMRADAEKLATPDRFGDLNGWRVTDRRLQALRRAGKITFDRKAGWSRS